MAATYDNAGVEFGYEWFGDASETPRVLLRRITIKVADNTVREYRVINGSGVSKLQQCGYTEAGSMESCLPPLTFNSVTAGSPTDDFAFGLEKITDGLGATTRFTYSLLSSPGSQFSERPFGNEIAPPDTVNLTKDKHVVTELRRSNGIGGDFVTNYAYHGDYAYHGVGLNSRKWGRI